MSIYILKTSHTAIKIGNSNACAINYNSALLSCIQRAKCFTLWKRWSPFTSPSGPSWASSWALPLLPVLPRTLLALTQASTPTSARFTFRSTALKSLSLVWISSVNSGLRQKALFVYIYTQDLYLTLFVNGRRVA